MQYIGSFVNLSGGCGKKQEGSIKAEFLTTAGHNAKEQILNPSATAELELAAGKYDVRIYTYDGTKWNYASTRRTSCRRRTAGRWVGAARRARGPRRSSALRDLVLSEGRDRRSVDELHRDAVLSRSGGARLVFRCGVADRGP